MEIILVPDSFKGTYSSIEVSRFLEIAARKHLDHPKIHTIPMADGGEGTTEAIMSQLDGLWVNCKVNGPLGHPVFARYGMIGKTAVMEMAQASGITLLPEDQRDPMETTTYGTGEMIRHALDQGADEIIIGIGGSATNDGGVGMAQALGVVFKDKAGHEIPYGGKHLEAIHEIDMNSLHSRIKNVKIRVMCDVTNPLTGPMGATLTYGPQKGASEDVLKKLEQGMLHLHKCIEKQFGINLNNMAGSGAAGGLGGGLVAFLGAQLEPGIDTLLDLFHFDTMLKSADLVITGEGCLDGQSVFGKVPIGVASRCKQFNVPVIAFVGSIDGDVEQVFDYGISAYFTTIDRILDFDGVMHQKQCMMEQGADNLFRLIKMGMELNPN